MTVTDIDLGGRYRYDMNYRAASLLNRKKSRKLQMKFQNRGAVVARMLDTDELYTAVERVFSSPGEASTTDLSKACRFCATDEQSVQAFEGVQVGTFLLLLSP